MITITVETDEEQAAVTAALRDGSLNDVLGPELRITRGWRTVGGSGRSNATMHASVPMGGAGGGGGTGGSSIARPPE